MQGLQANAEINDWHSRTLIPMLTRLAHRYGYATVTAIYKEAAGDGDRLKQLLAERLSPQFDEDDRRER